MQTIAKMLAQRLAIMDGQQLDKWMERRRQGGRKRRRAEQKIKAMKKYE